MQSCAQITRQVTLPFWPHTAASLSEEPSQAWQDKMPCQRVTVIYSEGSWHEELGVYDSDAVLLPGSPRLCSPCPTVPVAGGPPARWEEACGSQDLIMKRKVTHRVSL